MLKKILTVFLAFAILSCERKPLYLQGDCMISVTVTTQVAIDSYIDSFWPESWRDSLLYDWSKTGKVLGYTFPDWVDFVIFDGNSTQTQVFQTGKRELIDIELNKEYDFLIYNKTATIESEYVGGRYYIETPSTLTRSDLDNDYDTVHLPGEVFSSYVKGIYLSDDVSEYDEIYENDKLIYVYNLDMVIEPVSYIYIIQFIFINDDHTVIEAEDISNFTISGISSKKNLFTREPVYTGKKQVSTFEVEEGQVIVDSLVFASRITILDLLPKDSSTSWDTYNNYLYYTGIDVLTHTYGTVSGIVDITKQLNDNPKGGIITIRILNSEIKSAAGGGSDGGFGIDLNDWMEHHIDIE